MEPTTHKTIQSPTQNLKYYDAITATITNWLEWWLIQLIKMNDKQPMFMFKETLDVMKNTIKSAGVTTKPIRDFQE